jgi:hypothetical protein
MGILQHSWTPALLIQELARICKPRIAESSRAMIDQHAMVTALVAAKSRTERTPKQPSWSSAKAAQYAFDYDDETISELERAIAQASGVEPTGGDS